MDAGNLVMENADAIRARGIFSEAEIQAALRGDGVVGERVVEGVGLVKFIVAHRQTVEIPDQFGEGAPPRRN
jgi:hypothetical protein